MVGVGRVSTKRKCGAVPFIYTEALTKPETNKRLQDPTPVYDMELNRIPIQMMSVVVILVSLKIVRFSV